MKHKVYYEDDLLSKLTKPLVFNFNSCNYIQTMQWHSCLAFILMLEWYNYIKIIRIIKSYIE